MVGADQECVIFWPGAIEPCAKERALLQDEAFLNCRVEGSRQPARLFRRVGLRHVDTLQREWLGCSNEELRAIRREGRAKALVALQQAADRALQRAFVERTCKSQRAGFVVRQGGFRTQPISKPNLALSLRGGNDRRHVAERERVEGIRVGFVCPL
jgi:hypothetical protein